MSGAGPELGRAVVFDLDGTLIDTIADLADAVNHVLLGLGYPAHPVEAFRAMVGEGFHDLLRRALPAGTAEERHAEALALARARYAERLVVRTRPFPGVEDLLDALRARGVGAAIASNKPEALTRAVVGRVLGKWTFAAVLGQVEGRPRKPAPDVALEAARALGVEPSRCLLVGDSWIDMATARAAGLGPVGATWGYRSREELLSAGAVALIDHPKELLGLLEEEAR